MLSQFTTTRFSATRLMLFFFVFWLTNGLIANAQQQANKATGKSDFTAKLVNIEAATNEIFRYSTTLHNGSNSAKVYELKADLPVGWLITYKVDGMQVTSINLDGGASRDIAIEINTDAAASAKKYRIPVKAIAPADSLTLNLEAVVKGSYNILLTTPTGRLSDEVTSGSQTQLELTVKNTGTLPLTDLQITAQLPPGWESAFDPANIKQLDAGKTAKVTATVKVPDKTIAGDYSASFTAMNSHANGPIAYRLTVKTSLLSGWIGVLVILLAVGIVYYLIRKYGRR